MFCVKYIVSDFNCDFIIIIYDYLYSRILKIMFYEGIEWEV